MQFLHDKITNKPTENNLRLPNEQNRMTPITEISRENSPAKRKNRNPETSQ